jgi:hypothetical protein
MPGLRILFFGVLASLFLGACQNNTDPASSQFLNELSEKQIGDSKFVISLPNDYAITCKNGEDFSVYYFHPIDSTKTASFFGGIYFGNFPSEFKPSNNNCRTEWIEGRIIDVFMVWKVYDCNDAFSIQTIVNNKNNYGWDEQIHVFGNCKVKADLDKMLLIYSTLKKK